MKKQWQQGQQQRVCKDSELQETLLLVADEKRRMILSPDAASQVKWCVFALVNHILLGMGGGVPVFLED